MARDFYYRFRLGADNLHIASLDSSGVALAAIQGLYTVIEQKGFRIDRLDRIVREREARIGEFETRLSALAAAMKMNDPSDRSASCHNEEGKRK